MNKTASKLQAPGFWILAFGFWLLIPTYAVSAAGLDALDDDRLINELAGRGLETLLDRAFEVNQVPPDERRATRTLIALRELSDPDRPLTAVQRQNMLRDVVAGMEQVIGDIENPLVLMQQAAVLIQHGIEREVNALEYWGENPRTQAALLPIAETVVRMLDRAAELAEAESDQLADRIRSPDDPMIRRWMELDNLRLNAEYTRHMIDYALALAIEPGDPRRNEVVENAIEYLRQFDNSDSEVQPLVRLRIAKLHMAAGDFAAARERFESIAENPDEAIQPPPDTTQQYEARYFAAVCTLLEGNLDGARTALEDLIDWQERNIPAEDEQARAGVDAAAAMLQYRIHSLEAELADDAQTAASANEAAISVLLELVQEQPALRGIIFEQLISQLPDKADLEAIDQLLLQAMIQRGERERLRPEGEPVDRDALESAIAAARELIDRQDDPRITGELIEHSALLIPFFHDRLDRPGEAASAFLDYIERFPDNPRNTRLALEHALGIIGQLRRDHPEDPAVGDLYERFLPIAIDEPFGRAEFAYEYARRLQALGRYGEAVEYFRRVPEDDDRRLHARFYLTVALQQRMQADDAPGDDDRARITGEIQRLADEVERDARAAMETDQTDRRDLYRSMIVRTALIAGEIARHDNPRRTLGLLADFEQKVAGLPNENDLLGEALFLRVHSHMALGENTEATNALVQLLEKREGGQGANIVFNLLQNLDADYAAAVAAGDASRMRELARSRAVLSGFLVDWARDNPNPDIRRFTYRYRVFHADTQHLAGQLEDDPEQRRLALERALAAFEALSAPEAVAQYRETIPPDGRADPDAPDPVVMLGKALVHFDLGNHAEAQPLLGRLLNERKLGAPTRVVEELGQERVVDNEQYWEATYKLLRSNVELARQDARAAGAMEATRRHLRLLYVREGDRVGGQNWRDHFEALRAEIIPDFNPEDLARTTDPDAA